MNTFENQPSTTEELAERREKQRQEIESWVVSYLPTLGENLMVWVTDTEYKSDYKYTDAVRVEVRDSITQEICAISLFYYETLDAISDDLEREKEVLDTLKDNFDAQTSSPSFGKDHNQIEVQKAQAEAPIEKLKKEIAEHRQEAENLQNSIIKHNENPDAGIDFGFTEQLEEVEDKIKLLEKDLSDLLEIEATQTELRF